MAPPSPASRARLLEREPRSPVWNRLGDLAVLLGIAGGVAYLSMWVGVLTR